jgi:hypothetical protein
MSFEDFKRRARTATLVPVWKDILLDTDTAVSGVRAGWRRSLVSI